MLLNNPYFRRLMLAGWVLTGLAACQKPQAILEIDPSSGCMASPKVALQVTWDVRPLGLEESSIEVNSVGYPPKLWIREGASGTKETGAWAHDGFTVSLRSIDGKLLARRTFVHHACEPQ